MATDHEHEYELDHDGDEACGEHDSWDEPQHPETDAVENILVEAVGKIADQLDPNWFRCWAQNNLSLTEKPDHSRVFLEGVAGTREITSQIIETAGTELLEKHLEVARYNGSLGPILTNPNHVPTPVAGRTLVSVLLDLDEATPGSRNGVVLAVLEAEDQFEVFVSDDEMPRSGPNACQRISGKRRRFSKEAFGRGFTNGHTVAVMGYLDEVYVPNPGSDGTGEWEIAPGHLEYLAALQQVTDALPSPSAEQVAFVERHLKTPCPDCAWERRRGEIPEEERRFCDRENELIREQFPDQAIGLMKLKHPRPHGLISAALEGKHLYHRRHSH
jgi:hypothetical protein